MKAEQPVDSVADTLAGEEDDKVIDTQVKEKTEALFRGLAITLAGVKDETLSDTLAKVKAETIVDTLAYSLKEVEV